MTDQELLQAIKATVQEELKPVQKDIAEMKQDITDLKKDVIDLKKDVADLKESNNEVRTGVNTLLEWADKAGNSIEFPLPKIM